MKTTPALSIMSWGTEAFYAFDYGNIHFIVLDSYETDRMAGGKMLQWMEADLADLGPGTDWIIAYWHHPPYSKGSHDSDEEAELIEMRENAVPVLERHGVDLVLNGHSHAYERTILMDGHYGYANSYNDAAHGVDTGSGRADDTGAYRKMEGDTNAGTVYVVAGNAGQTHSGPFDHPAMFFTMERLGSIVLDIDGLVLEAKYIDHDGSQHDYFTIDKR